MLIAYLRNRDLFILDERGNAVFADFLFWPDDIVTADRVLSMYGYQPGSWRDHPRLPGILVCEIRDEKERQHET